MIKEERKRQTNKAT